MACRAFDTSVHPIIDASIRFANEDIDTVLIFFYYIQCLVGGTAVNSNDLEFMIESLIQYRLQGTPDTGIVVNGRYNGNFHVVQS